MNLELKEAYKKLQNCNRIRSIFINVEEEIYFISFKDVKIKIKSNTNFINYVESIKYYL